MVHEASDLKGACSGITYLNMSRQILINVQAIILKSDISLIASAGFLPLGGGGKGCPPEAVCPPSETLHTPPKSGPKTLEKLAYQKKFA